MVFDAGPIEDEKQINDEKVLMQAMRFGAEGAETTSSSYATIADSDLAIDFDELKDKNGKVYMKVLYHLGNETSLGEEVSNDGISISSNGDDSVADMAYSERHERYYFVDDLLGHVYIYDTSFNYIDFIDLDDSNMNFISGITYVEASDSLGSSDEDRIVILDESGVFFEFDLNGTEKNSHTTGLSFQGPIEWSEAESLIYVGNPNENTIGTLDSGFSNLTTYTGMGSGYGFVGIAYNKSTGEVAGLADYDVSDGQIKIETYSTPLSDSQSPDDSFDVSGQYTGSNSNKIYTFMAYSPQKNRYAVMWDETRNLYEYIASDGATDARVYRQNAGTAVSNTEVTGATSQEYEFKDTGWIELSSESGLESYQIQLKTSNGTVGSVNSAVLYIATPQSE